MLKHIASNEHQDSRINMWGIEMVKDIITNEHQGFKTQEILDLFEIKYRKKKFVQSHIFIWTPCKQHDKGFFLCISQCIERNQDMVFFIVIYNNAKFMLWQ